MELPYFSEIIDLKIYKNLALTIKPILAEDNLCLDLLKDDIQQLLKRNKIRGKVYGRTKGLYSLNKKRQI